MLHFCDCSSESSYIWKKKHTNTRTHTQDYTRKRKAITEWWLARGKRCEEEKKRWLWHPVRIFDSPGDVDKSSHWAPPCTTTLPTHPNPTTLPPHPQDWRETRTWCWWRTSLLQLSSLWWGRSHCCGTSKGCQPVGAPCCRRTWRRITYVTSNILHVHKWMELEKRLRSNTTGF